MFFGASFLVSFSVLIVSCFLLPCAYQIIIIIIIKGMELSLLYGTQVYPVNLLLRVAL